MTRSKSIIAALALCALSVFAFGAASASAKGLTAVECVEAGAGSKYNSAECLTPAVAGKFETKPIPLNTATPVEGTSTQFSHKTGNTAEPVAVFHSIFNGIEVTVTCGTGKTTEGSVTNKEEPAPTMRAHTTKAVQTWTECHASPRTKPTKICNVQGTAPATAVGSVKTNPLTSITAALEAEEHRVTISPEVEEVIEGKKVKVFTKFNVLASGGECFTPTAIGVTVTGEAWGRADTTTHSHLTLDEASNAGSPLRANGAVASQTETIRGTKKGSAILVGAETL